MKILHFVHGWFPRHSGGTEQYVDALLARLAAQGHTVAVVSGSEEGREVATVERNGSGPVPVYRLHRSGLYLESWYQASNPEAEVLIRELLDHLKPDLIHVHHWRRLSNRLVEVASSMGIPSVLTLHDTATTCARTFRVREDSYCLRDPIAENCQSCVERFWFQDDEEIAGRIESYRAEMSRELDLATAVLAPSLALRDVIESYHPHIANKIEVLPHPRLYSRVQPNPPTKKIGGRLSLAYWGGIQAIKGVHLLLEAVKRTLDPAAFSVDIWGALDGAAKSYVDRLYSLAEGLDVSFRGAFKPGDIPDHYDLAVFPSIALESYSFTVDEAWERNIPALVPDRGAPAERCGSPLCTFQSEDASDLGSRLQGFLDRPEQLEVARRAIPDLPSLDAHMDEILDIYHWVLDEFVLPSAERFGSGLKRATLIQRTLRARDERLYDLRGRADGESEQSQALKQELEERDGLLEKRDEILDEFNASLGLLTKTLKEKDRELEKVRNLLIEKDAFQSYRREEGEEVVAELNNHLEQYKRSTDELRLELDNTRQELHEARRGLTAGKEARESLLKSVQDHEELRTCLEEELKVVTQSALDHAAQGEKLTAELKETQSKRENLEKRLNREAEERARLEADLRGLRRQTLDSDNKCLELTDELQSKENARRELLREIDALRKKAELAENSVQLAEHEQEDLAQLCQRLKALRDNLMAEVEGQTQLCELTRDALDKALLEVKSLDRAQDELTAAIQGHLVPIAEEVCDDDLKEQPIDRLLDLVVANHGRLHDLIRERDEVLGDLVLRIDDYETRLAQLSKGGGSNRPKASDVARKFKSRVRGLSKRLKPKTNRSRKRILFIVHDFLPKHNAGTEIYTYNLAKGLQAEYDVHLLFCEARHELPRYHVSAGNYNGLPFTEVVHNYEWENFEETYHDPRMEEIFSDVLDQFEPDLVHFQHLHYFSFNFIPLAKKRGLPVVYTLHEFMLMCARGGQLLREDMTICEFPDPSLCADCICHQKLAEDYGQSSKRRATDRVADLLPANLKRAFEGYAGPRVPSELVGENRAAFAAAAAKRLEFIKERIVGVDLFISPSSFLRQKFIDYGMIRPNQIVHSDNGFDLTPFSGFVHQDSATLRFGFVGTIAEYKGVHVLVEAMNDIVADNVELQIWGDIETFADYKQRLIPLIKNPATKIMGRFDNARIAEVLANIDVLIVPSLWFENSPLTIHEAWLAGVPLVVSDRGGMAELVKDGVGGFHFKLGDSADLRKKLMRFVQDPSLVQKLGSNPGVVKPIADNVEEMSGRYQQLLQRVHR